MTNYHVIAKLTTDQSGLQRCKVISLDCCFVEAKCFDLSLMDYDFVLMLF